MDLGVFFAGIFGAGGVFSCIQYFVNRHDKRSDSLKRIEKKIDDSKKETLKRIDEVNKKCDKNELATTRLQLLYLLNAQPDNEDAIEQTAYRYFIELGGNAEAWQPFYRWAKEHNVDTDWYKALLKREEVKHDNSN